jgi:hypothetical protein
MEDAEEAKLRAEEAAVWVEAKNAGGKVYYWNRKTRQTLWVHPEVSRRRKAAAAAAAAASTATTPPPAPPPAHDPLKPYHHTQSPPSAAGTTAASSPNDDEGSSGERKRQRLSEDATGAIIKPGQEATATVGSISPPTPFIPATGVQRGGAMHDVLYNIEWRKPDSSASFGCMCGLECETQDELELHSPWCEAWEIDEFAPPKPPRPPSPTITLMGGEEGQQPHHQSSYGQQGVIRGRHLGKAIELVRNVDGEETRLRFVTQVEAANFLGTSSAIVSLRKRSKWCACHVRACACGWCARTEAQMRGHVGCAVCSVCFWNNSYDRAAAREVMQQYAIDWPISLCWVC